jgi:ankyrin repeat protein
MAFGADVDAKDSSGRTPLHYAVETSVKYGNDYMVTKLILKGASIEAKDNLGNTPLDLVKEIDTFIST